MNSNDNNDTKMISDLDCNETSKEITMNTSNADQKLTFTLTQDQLLRIEELRLTTIAGNNQQVPKTQQQQIHQVIEYGVRALEQQRRQYLRQREALRLMRSRQ